MKLQAIIGIFLLIVAAAVIAVNVVPESVITGDDEPAKYDVYCDVELSNPLLSRVVIGDVNCNSRKASIFSLYSIIGDSGNLQISAQGKTASTQYDVTETKTKIYSLKIAKLSAGSTDISVSVYNDDSVLIASKKVNINVGG